MILRNHTFNHPGPAIRISLRTGDATTSSDPEGSEPRVYPGESMPTSRHSSLSSVRCSSRVRMRLCVSLLVIGAAASLLGAQEKMFAMSASVLRAGNVSATARPPAPGPQGLTSPPIPERVPYRFLFHHIIVLTEQAAENERDGGVSDLIP